MKSQVGSGMRGDKRRTYRFQDSQVTDHITSKSANLEKVMKGNFQLLW
jgi:protein subunit release factor A